jgi:hypothetical protein
MPADANMTLEEAAAALDSLIDIRREVEQWRKAMYGETDGDVDE